MTTTITIDCNEDRDDDCTRYDFSATDGKGGFLLLDRMVLSSEGRTDRWNEAIKAKWGQDVEIRTFLNMP
jgi:hypothetical protein